LRRFFYVPVSVTLLENIACGYSHLSVLC
jgi:hypothetical protein